MGEQQIRGYLEKLVVVRSMGLYEVHSRMLKYPHTCYCEEVDYLLQKVDDNWRNSLPAGKSLMLCWKGLGARLAIHFQLLERQEGDKEQAA